MKTTLLAILLIACTNCLAQTGGNDTTVGEIVLHPILNVPDSTVTPNTGAEVWDEGTNNPESTGATKFIVNGKVIYIKQLKNIRIEQTEE